MADLAPHESSAVPPADVAPRRQLREKNTDRSLGLYVIVIIAVVSSVLVLLRSTPLFTQVRDTTVALGLPRPITALSEGVAGLEIPPKPDGLEMWTFARNHGVMYETLLPRINVTRSSDKQIHINLIAGTALTQRMLSGFSAGTPIADLIETERNMVGQVFSGPLKDVGFVDLTDRMREEGLLDKLNAPSLSPWSKQGRIFGLPHDVHPVLLAYRADIVEAAGIDVTEIETWDDFVRIMRPLRSDDDGDGKFDRLPLNLWPTNMMYAEAMMLQAGGGFFAPDGTPTLNHPVNARVIGRLVSWAGGPDQIAAEAPDFSETGNQLRVQGFVIAQLFPDWMGGVWMQDVPGLAGKVKLMPLPAWERGGRRTSVIGGTMLGVTKAAEDFDTAWELAKELYLDRELAETLFRETMIVSPVKEFWDEPFYDEPNEFFMDQSVGTLFIDQAPDVPLRASSPFASVAGARMSDAVFAVMAYAEANDLWDADALAEEAQGHLDHAQAAVMRQIERNVFVKADADAAAATDEPNDISEPKGASDSDPDPVP